MSKILIKTIFGRQMPECTFEIRKADDMWVKSLFLILTGLLSWMPLYMWGQTNPQVQLIQLNMPLAPFDTVYENQNYNISFTVQNQGSALMAGDTLFILAYNTDTTVTQQLHVLADTFITVLQPSAIVQVTRLYQFSSLNYKSGGNIVVVWPRLGNNPLTTYDSITVDIYFVPVPATVAPENQNPVQGVIIYRQHSCMAFKTHEFFMPEQVRIFDMTGRIFYASEKVAELFCIDGLHAGVYVIEWKNTDGRLQRQRFIWY